MAESVGLENRELVIIGGGPGGYVAAIRAAQLGLKPLLIERRPLPGGTCLHEGCIPSKLLLEGSWRYFDMLHNNPGWGIGGATTINLAALMAKKEKTVSELAKGITMLFRKNGVDWLEGEATLRDPSTIEVFLPDGTSQTVTARRIILATGSYPSALPFLPVDGARVIDSSDALEMNEIPPRLIVVGGGAIGLELGSIWARLGSKVTILETLPEILPGVDPTIIMHAKRILRKQGLEFHTDAQVVSTSIESTGLSLTCRDRNGGETVIEGDKILVAVGRKPNSGGIGAAQIGIELDPQGFIKVDTGFQTSVPGVYAIGDVIPGPMLAHKAMEEGMILVERLAGKERRIDYKKIPMVVYTHPEIAKIGLSEEQARESSRTVRTGSFSFMANGRAKTAGTADGVVKVIADGENDRILGVHIVGPGAADMIIIAATAISAGWSSTRLAEMIMPHPTLSETLKEAAMGVTGKPIHS